MRHFHAPVMGRPGLAPGRYVRLLLVGYFEGLSSERGIAWRAADSLAIRRFLHLRLEEATPDHSTISRTRRLIALETHRVVFTWVQAQLVEHGLLRGKTLAVDATTLEANAAMRSIVQPPGSRRRPVRHSRASTAARTCEGIRTSSSGCSSMPAPSILA
jgi:transposase